MARLPRRTIAEWRVFRFLTQEELAEATGVNRLTLWHWEKGLRQPHAKNLRKLAAALRIQPDQIILLQPPTVEES